MARRKKSVEKELKPTAEFTSTKKTDIPGYKTSFRKGGITYNIGDTIIAGIGDEAFEGQLSSVLSSQFVITNDEIPYGRFFFYNGTKLQMIKSTKPQKPKRRRRTTK